ncbi:MAG: hypothetical protein ACM3TR_07860 [Caulobacteraceae bacterium]
MLSVKRYKQLKNIINLESETDKEIRSDIEGKVAKNIMRIYEDK